MTAGPRKRSTSLSPKSVHAIITASGDDGTVVNDDLIGVHTRFRELSLEQLDMEPVRSNCPAPEQAGLAQQEGASADRTKRDALAMVVAQPARERSGRLW